MLFRNTRRAWHYNADPLGSLGGAHGGDMPGIHPGADSGLLSGSGSVPATEAGAPDAGNAGSPGDGAGLRQFNQADLDRVAQKVRQEERKRRDRDVADAVRLATLPADERAMALAETRAFELDAREAEITRRELRASALDALARKGLPASLADALLYTDTQSFETSLGAVERAFRPALQEGIEQRLRGQAPPKAGTAGQGRVAALRASMGLPNKR